MTYIHDEALLCPLDGLPLLAQGDALQCATGHSYDIARQGYVNLLGAADKRSRDPGDSKAMVAARGEFLAQGHYQPVAEYLSTLLAPRLQPNSRLLDAGCGEGYYLAQMAQKLSTKRGGDLNIIGFDISKWAVQAAARQMSATWLVASNRQIPLADNCVDVVLSLFGFPGWDSFHRVLKPDGILMVVGAGKNHLLELREVIYPEIRSAPDADFHSARQAGFTVLERESLNYQTAPLMRADIGLLLGMTPHLFRATAEGKQKAAQLDRFPVTVDVEFYVLGKAPSA